MEWMYQWIRNLAFFFVFLSALMNFLPGCEEKKYIRYFMGMLLILLLAKPILEFGDWGDLGKMLEQQVLADSLSEAYDEMLRESGRKDIAGEEYIKNACSREMEEQIRQLMEDYGYEVTQCKVTFFDGEVLEPREIRLKLKQIAQTENLKEDQEREDFLKIRLEEVYNIPEGNINISIQG